MTERHGERRPPRGAQLAKFTADRVFLNAWGNPYTVPVLSKNLKFLCYQLTQDRPGGPIAWYPHLIRRTWGKEMLHAGLNPYVVQRIIGDSFKVIDLHYGGFQNQLTSAFTHQLAKEIDEKID